MPGLVGLSLLVLLCKLSHRSLAYISGISSDRESNMRLEESSITLFLEVARVSAISLIASNRLNLKKLGLFSVALLSKND